MPELAELFVIEMRRRREALTMSQHTLGAQLGLDRNTISRMERTAPNLSVDKAAAIATALGTSLSAMLGGKESEVPGAEIVRLFGTRVREVRLSRGWNQRELSEHVGVDRNWISAIESGKKNISLRTLEKFATALAVLPLDLLG
jgi:transcriptional regulator with XRE-family HTH domain